MSLDAPETIYDSDQRRRPLIAEFSNFRQYRGLVRLLAVRDITVRYKRSYLGVWWTVLNPLLTTAVLWVVFSQLFRFEMDPAHVPYIVYLLSGILVVTYFSQGVIATGSSIVSSAPILTKVYIPPEVFALAAATAAAFNFLISLVPLLIIQLLTGIGIPWTVVLVPIPTLALLCFITGLGLLIAAGAVYFYDVIDLTGVFVQLMGYLTPSFYPLAIVPENLRIFIYLNPLYPYLLVFRNFVYLGQFPPWYVMAAMVATALLSLIIGVWVFSRSWKQLVVVL